jgi:hypothetical protein
VLTFFGLSDRYIEAVYEQIFHLKHYGGWSFFEAYNLPVSIRFWMLQRLIKQKQEEADAMNGKSASQRAQNTFKYNS